MSSTPDGSNQDPAPRPPCRGQWRVLVATDGSECACEAQEFLAGLPFPSGTAFHLVAVVADPFTSAGTYGDPGFVCWHLRQEVLDAEQEHAHEAVRSAAERLQRDDWTVSSATPAGDIAHEIVLSARRFRANLVVVGTRGQAGVGDFLLGSTARSITRHVACSVLVGHTPKGPVRQVLLAVDGSEFGCRAARRLAALPLPDDAQVTVLHVTRPYHPFLERLGMLPGGDARLQAVRQKQQEAAEQLVGEVCRRLKAAGKPARGVVRGGDPADEILRLARTLPADLLIAGARGSSVIPEAVVGSVAARALQCAPCSVLVVR